MTLKEIKTMTDEDLISEAKGLHNAIENFECFSCGDLADYEMVISELKDRGYSVNVESTLNVE